MFQPHQHVGFICGQLWQWRTVVFPYLAQGLAKGERCVYLTSLHTPWMLHNLLSWQGVDVGQVTAHRQLLILDAARYYLHRGCLNPERILKKNKAAVKAALAEGFTGLRSVADVSWVAYHPLEWERVEEYEMLINQELFPHYPVTGICLYDQQLFQPSLLQMVERTHPLMIDGMGQARPGGLAACPC